MEYSHDSIIFSTDPQRINSPAFYDCVVHLICTQGSARISYNNRNFEIKQGNIAVFSKPRLVVVEMRSDDFRCEYIAAPDKFLHKLLPANNYSIQGCVSLFSNPIIEVSEENSRKFRVDLGNIRCRIDDVGHRFYGEMIGSLLQTMMYDLFDFHAESNGSILTTDRVGYIISRFFAMLEAGHAKTRREVAYYAGELNVTPKYLSETVKRVTGRNVSSHIDEVATSAILEYLRDNRMSVTQIADEMNFSSVSYFSRYCKKHIGMSPGRFRVAGAKR